MDSLYATTKLQSEPAVVTSDGMTNFLRLPSLSPLHHLSEFAPRHFARSKLAVSDSVLRLSHDVLENYRDYW